MDIAVASADHQKALDLVTEEPTLDHLRQYEAAADIYTGFLGRRIDTYLRVGIAGFVVLVALYFLLDAPQFPGIMVVFVWVLGIMVPIVWNMRWLLMVRKLVVSAHVFVDTVSSLRDED
ncbi:hypothetical protein [Rhodococcoides fascians]|uniref:hypothetical protein n=1 Tax=Rhodococcoides fascians TaxID=1828 RepID=UPI00050C2654|nr:hypothetical protein [Rhodococcus fascians]